MSSPVNEVKPSEVVQLKRSRDAMCKVVVELQEQIKTLKEENYVLLSFQKEVDQMEAGLVEIDEDYEDMRYYDLPDVIKTLKEDNDKLKQFAMKVHNFAFCTKYDDEDIVSSFDLDAILEEMKKDEDKLNEDITSLKKHFNIIIDLIKGCDTDEKLQKLKELNTLG